METTSGTNYYISPFASAQLIQDIGTLNKYVEIYSDGAKHTLGCISVSDDLKEVDGFWTSYGIEDMLTAMKHIVEYYPAFKQRAEDMLEAVKSLEASLHGNKYC